MDIVKRLRDAAALPTGLYAEAAAEIEKLRGAITETLDENGHLADGDNCTLIKLKRVMPNVKLRGAALLRRPA